MRFLLVILTVLLSLRGYAQNQDNYLQVIPNTSLSFALNSVTKIENDQTLSNAISLQLSTKAKNREVFARISAATSPSGYTLTSPYPVKLLFVSHNSSNVTNLVSTALQLTNTDQRLFSQKKQDADVVFNYSMIFMATNWSYPPGNYSFTILFTLTPP